MQKKIDEMHKEVAHIQNSVWDTYKAFLESHDKEAYNSGMMKLMKEYCDKQNEPFLAFCKYLYIAWDETIRRFAEEFRNSE